MYNPIIKFFYEVLVMKTELISIASNGIGRDDALILTEKTAAFCGLDQKGTMRLRLLSEELIEFMNSFSNDLFGNFWLEVNGNTVEVHLNTTIPMDLQTRNEILSVASSGKNSAAKGFMGRIREMISLLTLPDDPETKTLVDQAMGMMSMGCQMGTHSNNYSWAMSRFVSTVEKENNQEEKDYLERSIVANLADDVTVNIVGSDVEMVICKTF